MSREIDERIVDMRFDNHDFESKVKTTIDSLGALNQSLDMTGSAKGFEALATAADGVDMSPLLAGVETVGQKFSALEVVAITALQNITNSAINTGKRLVESVTIDQVAEGWSKYDTQTKSIGTLVSQGNRLEDVNSEMNRLSVFTDETSYSMSQMTENIAKFTATGKSLNDSVTAMEGISLWAASAGQNASVANRAMYQLSQALGAGVMRKEDYRSIQNASMDTDEFRQICLDTAVALGTLRDNADGTYESLMADTDMFTKAQFSEHLTEDRWFTDDVMIAVYQKYAAGWDKIAEYADEKSITITDAIRQIEEHMEDFDITEWELKVVKAGQEARSWGDAIDSVREAVSTGWTKTFQLVFGNYEEATQLWTDLSVALYDVFAEPGNARNELLQESLMSGWNQLIETGIKNSDAYKDKIIEVAKEQGVAIDDMIERTGSFEESLKEGWATSDIFSDALQKLADETSNLSDEQLEEMGLTRKQVESFAKINEKIKEGSINLDDYIEKMGRMSGRENLLQAFWDAWEAIGNILGTVKRAFEDVFPPTTADAIYSITERIRDMTSNFKNLVEDLLGLNVPGFDKLQESAEETGEDFDRLAAAVSPLKSTFRGLFAIIDIVGQAVGAVVGGVMQLIGPIGTLGESALSVAGVWGDWVYELDQTIKEQNIFVDSVQGVVDFLKGVPDKLSGVFEAITGVSFVDAMETLKERIGSIKEAIHNFIAGIKNDSDETPKVGETLSKSLGPLGVVFDGIKKLLTGIFDLFKGIVPLFGGLASAVGTALSQIGSRLSEMFANADFKKLFDIVNGGVLTSISIGLSKFVNNLTSITSGESMTGLGGISKILKDLRSTLQTYQASLKADILLKIAGAIGILAASLFLMSTIDPDTLGGVVVAMSVMFAELVQSMKYLSDSMGTGAAKGVGRYAAIGATLIMIAGAVGILAGAAKKLGSLEPEQAIVGIIALGALLTELSLFLKNSNFDGLSLTKGAGLLLVASGISTLSNAVVKIAKLDLGSLIKGLVGLGVVLAELAIFLNMADFDGIGMIKGLGLMLVATAINLIALAVRQIGGIDTGAMIQGLVGLAAVLLEIGVFVTAMSGVGPARILLTGAGLLIMSNAILLLSGALKILSTIGLAEMAIAVGGLGVVLLELGIAVTAMQGAIGGAGALVVIALAVAILVPALKSLSELSLGELGIMLLALAGAFAVIGVAAALLTPIVPSLLAFGGAVALLGVGLLACAAAAELFAIALGTLAISGGAGLGVLVAGIAGFIGLIPAFVEAIAQGILNSIALFADSIPAFINAAVAIITALCTAVIECLPQIMTTIGVLLDAVIILLMDYLPKIVDAAVTIMVNVINGIAAKEEELIDAAMNLIISFIEGLASAIEKNTDRALEAINHLCDSILRAFLAFFGIHSPSTVMAEQGTNLVLGLISGIGAKITEAKEKIIELARTMLNSFLDFKSKFQTAAKDVVGGLVQGVKDKISSAASAARDLGSSLLNGLKDRLGISSPSKEMAKLGRFSDEGFAKGLAENAKVITDASHTVGEAASSSLSAAFDSIGDDLDYYDNYNPVITPVLDLTQITNGLAVLSSILNTQSAYGLALQTDGSIDGYNQNAAILNAVDGLNARVGAMDESILRLQATVNGGLVDSVAAGVRDGLNGAAVMADKSRIGAVVTDYQRTMARRGV